MVLSSRAARAAVVTVLLMLTLQAANAWIIPALAATGRFLAGPITNTVMWLGRATAANPTMARAFEWSITAHAAVIGALWFGKSDQVNTQPIEAKIVIAPNKDQPTVNPDPKRYDDPPAGALQPVPKASYLPGDTMPGSYSLVLDAIGAPAFAQYEGNPPSGTLRDVRTYEMTYGSATGANYATSTQIPNQDPDGSGRTKVYQRYKPGISLDCGTSGKPNCIMQVVYEGTKAKSCPTGYNLSGANCVLADANQVTKPAGTVPCEITRKSDNSWHIDPKNPECAALAGSVTQSADGTSLTVTNGVGETATVTDKSDGTRRLDFQNPNGWRSIELGQYDPTTSGRPILGISDGGGTNPNGGATGGGSTGGGSTGSGSGGSCGGTGQPACSIDDSGFDGKLTDGDGLVGKIDTHDQSIKDKLSAINANDKHGMDWTWLPQIPRVSCTPFEFGTGGRVMVVDLCSTFSVIREALGWLLYIFMAWGLFDLLVSDTTSKGRK